MTAKAKQQTPVEQFRDMVTETLKDKTIEQADKIEAIVTEFAEWLEAHQAGTAVEVVGGRVVVETIEAHGLRIGLDAMGDATRIEVDPRRVTDELTWSPDA